MHKYIFGTISVRSTYNVLLYSFKFCPAVTCAWVYIGFYFNSPALGIIINNNNKALSLSLSLGPPQSSLARVAAHYPCLFDICTKYDVSSAHNIRSSSYWISQQYYTGWFTEHAHCSPAINHNALTRGDCIELFC